MPVERTRLLVQLPEAPGDWLTPADYRPGFRHWVRSHGHPAHDHVVLIEPDPRRQLFLEELWADWPTVRILRREIVPGDAAMQGGDFWIARDAQGEILAAAADRGLVRTLAASSPAVNEPVATQGLDDLLRELAEEGELAMLVIDPRDRPMSLISDSALEGVHDLTVVTVSMAPEEHSRMIRALKGRGFRSAGRAWGEAGALQTFARSGAPALRLRALAGEARVRLGRMIVSGRDALPSAQQRAARAYARGSAEVDRARHREVLDADFGQQLDQLDRRRVRSWAAGLVGEGRTWSVGIQDDVDAATRACVERHGVWPISFSYPGDLLPIESEPADLIAPIIPGFAYAFDDHVQYMRAYQQSLLGVTHHKAGWDCFRHVEILAAGAVPLMPDAAEVPASSMTHYPKQAMIEVARRMKEGGRPDETTRAAFRAHLERHLTSRAMAEYLLRASGHERAGRILFVDQALQGMFDYQSALTLIGLKQVRGAAVEVAYPVDWIYADHADSTSHMYGRGFGYSRTVDPAARTDRERSRATALDATEYDLVIVGSAARNPELVRQYAKTTGGERLILIHGEDLPPSREDERLLRSTGATLFVRSIHD